MLRLFWLLAIFVMLSSTFLGVWGCGGVVCIGVATPGARGGNASHWYISTTHFDIFGGDSDGTVEAEGIRYPRQCNTRGELHLGLLHSET